MIDWHCKFDFLKGDLIMVKVVNCTPHTITVRPDGLDEQVFEPSGIVPRVSTSEKPAESIAGIPCSVPEVGAVTGIPAPDKGVFYLVSRMVFDATPRKDVIAPNTGATAIRNDKGHIVAVKSFLCKK